MKSLIFYACCLVFALPALAVSSYLDIASPTRQKPLDSVVYGFAGIARYNYDLKPGTTYHFDLPTLQLAASSGYALKFDIAYAHRQDYADAMTVFVSTDNGQHWTSLYSGRGETLSTTGTQDDFFIPEVSDWRAETISLPSHEGNVEIRFQFISAGGNNLYLDNLRVEKIQVQSSAASQ